MTARSIGIGRWLVHGVARPGRRRLFCFPHGGGSVAEFIRWSRNLPELEISGIQLPGRGTRLSEPALTTMDELVAAVTQALPTGAPYSMFGHSFGALVAYEVTRALLREGRPLPETLVVSGFPAPSTPRTASHIHTLPDEELINEVSRRHDGVPPEVLAQPELKAIVARYLRADYQILETYEWRPGEQLPVPLTVFSGRDDKISAEALRAWQRHTVEEINVRMFPGGHFYFRQHEPAVLRALAHAAGETRMKGAA